MEEKKLDYFIGLKYGVLIKKNEDIYCAFIPELSLFADGNTASEAYEKLEQEKIQYFKRLLAIGAADIIKEPLLIKVRKRLQEDLLLFGLKTLIMGIILGTIIAILVPTLDVFINARIKSKMSLGGIIVQVDDKLRNMNEKDLGVIRDSLRRIIVKVKPITDELKVLFDDDKGIEKKLLDNQKPNSPGKSNQ